MKLVLLPGLDGSGELFAEFVGRAPPDWDCVVIPYPPTTQLDYRECAAWVSKRLPHGEDFLLLGESFSGPVSILVASSRPPGLAGLILCGTFTFRPSWACFRFLPWRLAFRRPISRITIGLFVAGWSRRDHWIGPIRKANALVSPEVHAHRMRSVLAVDVRSELSTLETPVLDLRGTRDRLVGRRSSRLVRRTRPDARIARVPGPHLILQTAPQECWRAITAFRDRVTGAIPAGDGKSGQGPEDPGFAGNRRSRPAGSA